MLLEGLKNVGFRIFAEFSLTLAKAEHRRRYISTVGTDAVAVETQGQKVRHYGRNVAAGVRRTLR